MAATVNQIRWAKMIAEKLFADNSILKRAINDNQYLDGKTVVRPQAGNLPPVRKNTTTYPVTATPRMDTVVEYDTDEYALGPVKLGQGELETISYNKMASVTNQIVGDIEADVVDNIHYAWCPSAASLPNSVIVTTGNAKAADTGLGMTGYRLAIVKDDIMQAREIFNKQNIDQKGRMLLIPATMETDIMNLDEFIDVTKITVAEFRNGLIGRILGFDVYVRDRVIICDGTTYEKSPVTASGIEAGTTPIAATDSHGALFLHEKSISYAYGTLGNSGVTISLNPNRADYDGADLVTGIVRAGASPTRNDHKGILLLVQGT